MRISDWSSDVCSSDLAILLDPPKFGRGPNNERWQIEEGLAPLLADCGQLLDADSRALFLTVYAVRMSALAIGELLSQTLAHLPGPVECGERDVREEARGFLPPTDRERVVSGQRVDVRVN